MAVTEEVFQLHTRDTFRLKSAGHMTKEQNQDTLESLIFLKFKSDGIVKYQTCVGGQKQGKHAVPGDATYPIVSTESLLITETIDAHEVRDVGI